MAHFTVRALARPPICYRRAVPLCVFDLDHTLVRSPLDLAAMALDMRGHLEARWAPLPARPERYRVGELIALCQSHAPRLEADLWSIALDHERKALVEATLEPGAMEAVRGARAAGFHTALWTNNAREITLPALERFGLEALLDITVTRDEMRQLKPDPDGWRVIAERSSALPGAGTAERGSLPGAVVVGDSWVDGVAAAAAGVPFIAYRTDARDLQRWRLRPIARLTDLGDLPTLLAELPALLAELPALLAELPESG
jgi:phosphoglycolate phosphatase-like HAD superfamily hydrolase